MLKLVSGILIAAPTPTETTDPASTFYSPGTLGFIFVFGISLAAIFLIFDMVRRVRRVRYKAEINERLDAEESGTKATGSGRKSNK